jgi:hypothetical protein
VGPADHLVPSAIGQFVATRGAVTERERHTEGAGNRLIGVGGVKRDKPIFAVTVEDTASVVKRTDWVVAHKLRHCRLDFRIEYPAEQVGPLRKRGDDQPLGERPAHRFSYPSLVVGQRVPGAAPLERSPGESQGDKSLCDAEQDEPCRQDQIGKRQNAAAAVIVR